MSKYDSLGAFLKAQPVGHVPMTFDQIEHLLGFKLPPVAKRARAWWSNNPSNNVMTKVWTAAGFRSEQVDMASEKLVFRRVEDAPRGRPSKPPGALSNEALSAVFGCLRGTVILDKGLDLTAPADPAWGDARR